MTPTQSERLLSILRAANGGAVSEGWIIAALWGGKPPCTVYELLRVIVSEARRGAEIVRHRDRAYVAYSLTVTQLHPVSTDVHSGNAVVTLDISDECIYGSAVRAERELRPNLTNRRS